MVDERTWEYLSKCTDFIEAYHREQLEELTCELTEIYGALSVKNARKIARSDAIYTLFLECLGDDNLIADSAH